MNKHIWLVGTSTTWERKLAFGFPLSKIFLIRPKLTIHSVSMMLLCSWASAHLQGEPEVRTVLFASGTLFAYLMNAFIPIAAFPASEAPNWRIGSKLYLGFAVFSMLLFVGIYFTFKWEEKKRARRVVKDEDDRVAREPESEDGPLCRHTL
jgi:hypothetical protein